MIKNFKEWLREQELKDVDSKGEENSEFSKEEPDVAFKRQQKAKGEKHVDDTKKVDAEEKGKDPKTLKEEDASGTTTADIASVEAKIPVSDKRLTRRVVPNVADVKSMLD